MTRAALALVLSAAAAACATNPATGGRQLSLVSKEQEIELGKQGTQDILQQFGRYPDAKTQAYVERIGKAMAAKSERPELPWTFTVLDDPLVNAFALPGGPVFVTRGILAHMNSEAELASVLGHEIGHITARHSAEQISKAQLAQVGLGVGMILSDDLRQYGQVAGIGLQLAFLKFGRDDERQADELGFRYMTAQGYDPREMADVFETLARASKGDGEGGGGPPEWLSTHPDPGNRAETAEKRAAEVKGADRMKVGRDEFLAMLGGMPFGEDPRQGYFQGNAFLHPELRFRMELPEGWQKQNTPAAVVAVSPKNDAAIQLTAAGKVSPEEAQQKFFSQQGVKPASFAGGGLPPGARYFEAQTKEGAIGGLVAFFSHGGSTLQLLGYTAAQALGSYDPAFKATLASFKPLTDPAALAVQPARVELVKVPRDMTISEFNAQFPSTVPLEVVATVNGRDKAGRLQAGQTAKRIVGGNVPNVPRS